MAQPTYQEIECKFLEVDVGAIKQKLEKLGAKAEPTKLFRRYTFDFPDRNLAAQKSWVRLRDEGDKVTFTFKQRQGVTKRKPDTGMREIETTVGDMETSVELLKAIGLEVKFYEENRRTKYCFNDVEFCLDEWPLIPPYLEIESTSWAKVEEGIKLLGLKSADKQIYSTMQVYERYGINENDYQVITFDRQEKRAGSAA